LTITTQELINFHVQHKYYILVQKEEDGVSVNYPANIVFAPLFAGRVDVYKINKDKIEYANSDGAKVYFKTNIYDARVLITTDIVINAKIRGISGKLILPFEGLILKDGVVGLLKQPTKKEHQEKEQKLIQKYQDIIDFLKNSYTREQATKDGIVEGYGLVRNLLASGGIYQFGA
jgi:hypothetical protein